MRQNSYFLRNLGYKNQPNGFEIGAIIENLFNLSQLVQKYTHEVWKSTNLYSNIDIYVYKVS